MSLKRLGLLRSGMIDYPGCVAAVLFTMGCPLRCPYCHNPELIHGSPPEHFLPQDEVLEYLHRRRSLLQGVVITGGEPLRHHDLPDLIQAIGDLGLQVKVDTSGIYPGALQGILQLEAVQYVAMDMKTLPHYYHRVLPGVPAGSTRGKGMEEKILQSIRLLRSWRDEQQGRELEFRTTCVPGIINPEDLPELSRLLCPGDTWTLTQFRPGRSLDPAFDTIPLHPDNLLTQTAEAACRTGIRAATRGTN